MQPYKNLSIIVQEKAEMINKAALRFTALASAQTYFLPSKPYRKKSGRSERSYGTHFRYAERERRHIKHFAVRFRIARLLATAIVFQSAPVKLKRPRIPSSRLLQPLADATPAAELLAQKGLMRATY